MSNNKPKIAIIQFPGTNCEYETKRAVDAVGMKGEFFRWNESAEKLDEFDGYVIAGGFSYEDRSRSGVIASMDSVMNIVKKEAKLGKPVLGICNGAQILMESGLVPGVQPHNPPYQQGYTLGGALAVNKRVKNGKVLGTGFYNAWAYLKSDTEVFGQKLKTIKMPLAHGEGRFVFPDVVLKQMIDNGQVAFRYCNKQENIIDEFPVNPNGSVYNIAGVVNPEGNVVAIMPHPERCEDGFAIFDSMKSFIEKDRLNISKTLEFKKENEKQLEYHPDKNSIEIFVELIIADNEALTIQNSLKQLGYNDIKIKKWVHWEVEIDEGVRHTIGCRTPVPVELKYLIKQIILSGELLNTSKETAYIKMNNKFYSFSVESGIKEIDSFDKDKLNKYLVRYKESFVGQSKMEILEKMHINGIQNIKHGIVWGVETEKLKDVLKTNIFYNPFSQDCFVIK